MSSENAAEETKGYIELENAEEIECSTPTSKQPENVLNGGSAAATSNGRGLNSLQVVPSAKVNHPLRLAFCTSNQRSIVSFWNNLN